MAAHHQMKKCLEFITTNSHCWGLQRNAFLVENSWGGFVCVCVHTRACMRALLMPSLRSRQGHGCIVIELKYCFLQLLLNMYNKKILKTLKCLNKISFYNFCSP